MQNFESNQADLREYIPSRNVKAKNQIGTVEFVPMIHFVERDADEATDLMFAYERQIGELLRKRPNATVFAEGNATQLKKSDLPKDFIKEVRATFPFLKERGLPETLNAKQKQMLVEHEVVTLMLAVGVIKELRPSDLLNTSNSNANQIISDLIIAKRNEILSKDPMNKEDFILWGRDVRDLIVEKNLAYYFKSKRGPLKTPLRTLRKIAHTKDSPVLVIIGIGHTTLPEDVAAGIKLSSVLLSSPQLEAQIPKDALDEAKLIPPKEADWRKRAQQAVVDEIDRLAAKNK